MYDSEDIAEQGVVDYWAVCVPRSVVLIVSHGAVFVLAGRLRHLQNPVLK